MSVRLVQWSKNLKVGHKDIDEQHQGLFKRFDEFIEATLQDKEGDKVKSLISFLMEYTEKHFTYEEAYYSRKHYPKISAHRKAHETFTNNLKKSKEHTLMNRAT